jgi:hypothetical protein
MAKVSFVSLVFVFIFALLLPRLPLKDHLLKEKGSKQRNKETKVEIIKHIKKKIQFVNKCGGLNTTF